MNRRQLLQGAVATAAGFASLSPAHAAKGPPQVFLLRGGVVGIFSTGMDEIAGALRKRGVQAAVEGHTAWSSVARQIALENQQLGKSPVALVGHSFGADAIIKVAEILRRDKISVDILISIAATNPDPLPPNVRRAVSYYFSEHGWGLPLVGATGFRGKLSNRDYSGAANVGHFNIDKQRSVQDEIMQLVLWTVGR
ncbi:MAG: lipase [Rhizobiaceae bacterium]|nr:lipase [Rhizobiaceae bacterium]